MKSKKIFLLMILLAITVYSFESIGQEEKPKSQMFIAIDDVVLPSMVSAYEEAMRNFLSLMDESALPYSYYVFSTADLHYYYLFPIENLDAMDDLFNAFEETAKKMGEERYMEMYQKLASTYESSRVGVITTRPDLSYVPEDKPVFSEGANFRYWGFCYGIPGMEKNIEESFKKFSELYAQYNIPEGWETYMGMLGTDNPFYFYVESGTNAGEFWSFWDEIGLINEAMSKEAEVLYGEFLKALRKIEHKTGWFRPELSYMPVKE